MWVGGEIARIVVVSTDEIEIMIEISSHRLRLICVMRARIDSGILTGVTICDR